MLRQGGASFRKPLSIEVDVTIEGETKEELNFLESKNENNIGLQNFADVCGACSKLKWADMDDGATCSRCQRTRS